MCPLTKVTIVQGDTALTPDQGPTCGSLAIQIGGVQIRHAAATARSALIELAAKQLGADVADADKSRTASSSQRAAAASAMAS